ncbi:hypothetical protein DACRYDRAFT_108969 [Dacryopinax primogenitus]|uniref:Uncharacterized protein n=1 Tax=Dacryopinax primogenitus (strain DJM 731) TaxID=1858805 RepID=M5G309_DACPD|nr:uncharacterized protein DACRYDRAFT_108969 [Dacryopinax primogenitus]EJU00222.1 hypothetical protein DACRYDRAFT_108969 [Dacryopinax primogenitus]
MPKPGAGPSRGAPMEKGVTPKKETYPVNYGRRPPTPDDKPNDLHPEDDTGDYDLEDEEFNHPPVCKSTNIKDVEDVPAENIVPANMWVMLIKPVGLLVV